MRTLEEIHQSLQKNLGSSKSEEDTLNLAFFIKVDSAVFAGNLDSLPDILLQYKEIDQKINPEFHKRIGEIAV